MLINLRSDDGQEGGVTSKRSIIVPRNLILQFLLYAPFDGPESQFCLPVVTLELLTLLVALVEASHLRRHLDAYGAGLLHLAVGDSLLVPLCSRSILSLRIRAEVKRGYKDLNRQCRVATGKRFRRNIAERHVLYIGHASYI